MTTRRVYKLAYAELCRQEAAEMENSTSPIAEERLNSIRIEIREILELITELDIKQSNY